MRRSRKPDVIPAEEAARMSSRIPLENRLAELREVPGVMARIRRVGPGGGGNDLAGGIYPVQLLHPLYYGSIIREDHGGGSYEMRFHMGKKPLLLTNGRLETYRFSIAGEPKTTKKEKSVAETIIGNLPHLIESLDQSTLATLAGMFRGALGGLGLAFTTLIQYAGPDAVSGLYAELYGIYQENGWDIEKMSNALTNFLAEAGLLQRDETAQEGTPTGSEG